MSDGLIALFFGAGVGGWSYFKLARQTGNASPSSTALTAGVIGLIAAIFIYTLGRFVLHF